MTKLDAFLAGDRPDDVAIFLADDALDSDGKLADYGQSVAGGVVVVADGEEGRRLFQAGTGMEAMAFAREAMGTEGHVDRDLSGGECAETDGAVRYVLAFAEPKNEEVGGIYAEGDVIHAYAYCEDGTAFSDRWVVGDE